MSSWTLLAAAPLLPLGITLFNLATWRRGRAEARSAARVSVLIPARNEEQTIEACVRAIAEGDHPVHEIIVCDDQSTDETGPILARLTDELPMLRVIRGRPLPAGWVGKPHACHQLAEAASGDILFYVDADTILTPSAIARLLSLFEDGKGADVVTAVPHQVMGSFAERLVMPLLVLTYTSWLPLVLISASQDPRFLAANGQLLAIRRDAYERIGGFAAVAHEIVDDVAFCRLAKERGARVIFADGTEMARCRMYASARGVWDGFSKNIYEGIGGTPFALLAVLALHLLFFVFPYVGLVAGLLGSSQLLLPSALGVGAILALRAALVWRHRQPVEGIALHPLSIVALCAIAVNSFLWSRRGRLVWAGRSYAGRQARRLVAS